MIQWIFENDRIVEVLDIEDEETDNSIAKQILSGAKWLVQMQDGKVKSFYNLDTIEKITREEHEEK